MKASAKVRRGSLKLTTEFGWKRRYLIDRRGSKIEVTLDQFAPLRALLTRKTCGCLAVNHTTINHEEMGRIIAALEQRAI